MTTGKKNILSIRFKRCHGIFVLLLIFTSFNNKIYSQTSVTKTLSSGSGTWVVPYGVTSITVKCWGAGGAGGGSTSNGSYGSGGGGGAYVLQAITVVAGDSFTYSVGTGGTGSTGAGTAGGNTTFSGNGYSLSAGGGGGGAANGGAAGSGGTASGGSTNTNGNTGGTSTTNAGGSSPNGGSGGTAPGANSDGNAGTAPGGGGSGSEYGSPGNRIGGDGGVGRITIDFTYTQNTYTMGTSGSQSATISNNSEDTPDKYYDNGGSGSNYSNNVNATYTFNCAAGKYVRMKVSYSGSSGETFKVYDGTSTSDHLCGEGWYSSGGSTYFYCSTSGSLTIAFTSDASTTNTGWSADIWIDSKPGQIWNGSTSTAYSTSSNWEASIVPGQQTSIYIPSGLSNYPVISGSTNMNSLNVQSGASISNTVSGINVYGDIVVDGTFTQSASVYTFIKGGTSSVYTNISGSGDLSSMNLVVGYGVDVYFKQLSSISINYFDLDNSSANASVYDMNNYNLTVSTTLAIDASQTFYQRTGTLSYGGSATPTINNTSFNENTGTTIFTRAGTQTIPAITYFNLSTTGAGTKTFAASTVDIDGAVDIGSTSTLATGSFNCTVAGNWTNNGTFTCGTGTVTFDGTSTVNSGGSNFYNVTLNGTSATLSTNNIAITNNLTVTAGTFAIGSLTATVTGTSTIAGTTTISTGTLDANGTFNATGGNVTFTDDGYLYLGSTVTSLGTLTLSYGADPTTGCTVVYDALGAQNVDDVDYYNLTIDGSGTKTLTGNIDIGGSNGEGLLTVDTGCTFAIGDNTITHSNLDDLGAENNTIAGTVTLNNGSWTPTYGQDANLTTSGSITVTGTGIIYLKGGNGHTLGTFTPGSGTVYYSRNGAMSVAANTFNHLIIAGTSGAKTLTGNVTVNGDFTNSSTGSSFNASSYTLTAKGNFVNDATFTASTGTVSFEGTSAQTISGTTDPIFYNLTINNSSATGVTLGLNTSMTNQLVLTDGLLYTVSYTLTLGTNASNATVPAGSSTSYLVAYNNGGTIGYVKQFVNSNATYNFPIGEATKFTPLTFTLNTNGGLASANLIVHTKASSISGMNASITQYISRQWVVTESGFTTPNYDISYIYNDADIVGTETGLLPIKLSGATWYKPTGSSFTTGTAQGTGSVTTGTNTLSWTGLSTFSIFGGAVNGGVALPVELYNFDVTNFHGNVKLNWKTANEINNDHFEIERSEDGENFEFVNQVKGAGNSNYPISYFLIDENYFKGINYYRLTMVDFNGAETFSPILSIDMSKKSEGIIIMTVNSIGQEVKEDFKGVVFDIYSDGSSVKRIQ